MEPFKMFKTRWDSEFDTYEWALAEVYDHGVVRGNRTGKPARSVFGIILSHDLSYGLPLVTTKRLFHRGVIEELAWMLRGETNIRSLQAKKVHIWDEWSDADGELGPVYGAMWRAFPGPDGQKVDQVQELLTELRRDPLSRRLLVSAWCPPLRTQQALPPCHYTWQVYVSDPGTPDARLHLSWTQRSADMFLGVPFNLASYAILTHLLAHEIGVKPGTVTGILMDAHIYEEHIPQVEVQLTRSPLYTSTLTIKEDYPGLFSFGAEHLLIEDYECHEKLEAPVAV